MKPMYESWGELLADHAYGHKALRPTLHVRVELEPTTWRHRWHRFMDRAIDVILLALILMCFSYLLT